MLSKVFLVRHRDMSAVQQKQKFSEGDKMRVSDDEDPFVEPNREHAVQVGLH